MNDQRVKTDNEDSLKSWYERLKFYTKDFTKKEALQLCDYVAWVKWEGEKEKIDSIKDSIQQKSS